MNNTTSPLSRCHRCGAAREQALCARCGFTDDNVEVARQEAYLSFVLQDILQSANPVDALQRWKTENAARLEALSTVAAATAPAEPTPAEPAAQVDAPAPVAIERRDTPVDMPAVEMAPATTAPVTPKTTPTKTTPTKTAPRPLPPPRPTPQPARVLSAAEARAQFERRLELGGWFTGAVFAVGGSLWATNLFWSDIPAALRPAIVGAGLAAFAAAFMAIGAVLARRHRDSLAGHVLGLVGRLIAVSSTVPLALLRKENLPLALVTDVVVLVALFGALRFARSRASPEQASSDPGALWFLGGLALAVVGPTSAWLGIPIGVAALALTGFAIAAFTGPALAGQRTVVDDVSLLAVGGAALISAVSGCREDLSSAQFGAVVALAFVAASEVLLRLIEQRPPLFAFRGVARWMVMLLGLFTAVGLIGEEASVGPVAVVVGLLFVCGSFYDPTALGLPRFFRLIGVVAAGMATGYASHLVPLEGDARVALALTLSIGVIFALTERERRGANSDGALAALLFVELGCAFAALARTDDGFVAVPALVAAAALFVTDRRAERSPLFNLVTVGVVLAPVMTIGAALELSHTAALGSIALVVFALAAVAARHARPQWPLIALTTALSVWLVVVASVSAAVAVFGHGTSDTAIVAALVAAAALLVMQEVSRQVDLGVVGVSVVGVVAAVLVRDAIAPDDNVLVSLPVIVLALAGAAFLPVRRFVAPLRLLTPRWSRLGRARFARPWSLVAVSSSLVALLALSRVFTMMTPHPVLWSMTSPALLLAAVVLFLRHPTWRQGALVFAVALVAGGEAGVALEDGSDLTGSIVASLGLGVGLAALVLAVVVVVVRMRRVTTPIYRRLQQQRRPRAAPRDAWWNVVVSGAIIAFFVACSGAGSTAGFAAGSIVVAAAFAVFAATAAVLFAGRAVGALVVVGVFAADAAPLTLALRALLREQEVPTLLWALGAVAVVVVGIVGARALYRRRAVPALLEAWPRPVLLRQPSFALLVGLAALVGLGGFSLHVDHARDIARDYGPGLIIVAAALMGAGLLALRTRRTVSGALIGATALALCGAGIDGVVHAAGWAPPSSGLNESFVTLGLVAVLALLDRASLRRRLVALGLGWSRAARTRLSGFIVVVVPLMAAFACLLAVRDAPRAHELGVVIASFALVALGVVRPTVATARLAATGVVVFGCGVFVTVARVVIADEAFTTRALPLVLMGGLLGALAVQTLSLRVWNSAALRAFHQTRLTKNPELLATVGHAMRDAVEAQALGLTALVAALTLVDGTPATATLLSTWLCMGLVVIVTARMGVDREQTWPAALAQGMALAVYVDIRRRTPWLDDVGGIDAIACLVAAAVFIALSIASRRQPRGASTARAAELYAATLPVIAATFGADNGWRAVICLVGGGLYAVMSRTRRKPGWEFASGALLVAAALFALIVQGVDDVALYLMPVAFVGTFLARRHRALLGDFGRYVAVWCHAPLYCASAWSALRTESFATFALGIVLVTVGVGYAIYVRDRRSLYAAAAAGLVLVVGRLVLLGLSNALLGTLLLAGAGILVLGVMTVFTIRRDVATNAMKSATRPLDAWEP